LSGSIVLLLLLLLLEGIQPPSLVPGPLCRIQPPLDEVVLMHPMF
jgi:hypothetical protein